MRLQPNLRPAEYKTYAITAPISTHFRPGTCEEADCPNYRSGWKSVIDERSDLGQAQAHYIRKESGRKFTESQDAFGLTTFTFEAGQPCFTQHKVRLERPELYIVRDGDWRGNPLGTQVRQHTRPELWAEDFAEHQDRLARTIEKG
ncbi:hypothetical protein [Streptomyces pseudogriseolus]|uniref:hypothetical protein n=1 Tax=Streptomyces pseudogriseolus TaxID=36817 RepID=UPI003FA1F409